MTKSAKGPVALLLAATSLLIPPLAQAKDEAILEWLPADTHFVLLAPDIGRLNKQFGLMLEKMKVPVEGASMGDVAGLLGETGLAIEQLDRTGSAALIIRRFGEIEELDKELVIMAPVKDFAKFLADNKAVKQADGLAKIEAKDEAFFVKPLGAYAVFGADAKAVAGLAKPDTSVAGTLPADHVKQLMSADMSAHLDAKGMVAAMRMAVEMQPQAAAVVTIVKALSKQLTAYGFTAKFDADGAEVNAIGLAREGSELAKYLVTAEVTDKPLIAGIDGANLLAVAGWLANTKTDVQLGQALMPETADVEAQAKPADSGVFAMLATRKDGKLGPPLLFQAVLKFADEKTAQAAADRRAENSQAGMGDAKVERTTEKIGGVDVTTTKMTGNIFGPMTQLVQMLIGQDLVVRQGVKGSTLVMMVGGESKVFGQLLADVADHKPLRANAAMTAVRKRLHERRAGEVFLMARPAESVVRSILSAFTGGEAGEPVLPDVPVGLSWTFTPRSVDFRVFVPVELLAGLSKLAAEAAPPVALPEMPDF